MRLELKIEAAPPTENQERQNPSSRTLNGWAVSVFITQAVALAASQPSRFVSIESDRPGTNKIVSEVTTATAAQRIR
jgi:hypothetical protein